MTEKLYVSMIGLGSARIPPGYDVASFMRLSEESAAQKADLDARIKKELEVLSASPTRNRNMRSQVLDSLYSESQAIRGPIKHYAVRIGACELGQILDEVPPDSIPLNEAAGVR